MIVRIVPRGFHFIAEHYTSGAGLPTTLAPAKMMVL